MELTKVRGLKKEEIDLLSKNWITTAEEFISIYVNKTLAQNLKNLLLVDDSRFSEIVALLNESIPESKIKEIKKFKNFQFKTGAKKPKK